MREHTTDEATLWLTKYRSWLRVLLRRYGIPDDEVEDGVQDVSLKLWLHWAQWHDVGKGRANWAAVVTHHYVLDYHRTQASRARIAVLFQADTQDTSPDPADAAQAHFELEALWPFLNAGQQEVAVQTAAGYGQQEIADRIRESVPLVKARRYRLRQVAQAHRW